MDKKVKLTYYDLEDNLAVESVWATKDGEYYRIKNAPFFAPNLAYNDLIKVEIDEGELHFDELIEASEHSTLQIVIYNKEDMESITKQIEKLNCNWEGSHLETYISVDIPCDINYKKIKEYIGNMRSENKLDYKESCLSTLHQSQL